MCPQGPQGPAKVLVTEQDMELLTDKGWKIVAGWLLSPQAQAGMRLLPKIGVQGPAGPS
jgi:hypothetical protein